MTRTYTNVTAGVQKTSFDYFAADGITLLTGDMVVAKPVPTSPQRLAILVHGGGFETGDRTNMQDMSAHFVQYLGFVCFEPDYRLGPTYKYPAAVDDVNAAIAAMYAENAVDSLFIDTTKLAVLGGFSAGGTISAEVMQDDANYACYWSWSGLFDFQTVESQPSNSPTQITAAVTAYTGHNPTLMNQASPALHVNPASPPSYLVNSDLELMPEEQMAEQAAALTLVGASVTTKLRSGTQHAGQYLNLEWQSTLDWITNHLTGPTVPFLPGTIHAAVTT